MASGKETPRQKMVGMMYLVLTALLALQVSSALIYKFQSLNESLQNASKETGDWNAKKLARIEKEIEKRGSQAKEVKLLNSAKSVSSKSRSMNNYIESLKNELIKETGGYDEDGSLKGAKEETKVEVMMIGANKNGKAYELKKKLEEYVKYMNENSSTKYPKMALDGKDDPLFKNNADQKNKDFAELNFGQTPLVASLAILSEIQSRVTTMETTSITALGEQIGITDFVVDKMMPMVSPKSKIVAAGTNYEAQLFMVATSSSLKPTMALGTNKISVDENGVGKISFTASGGAYDPQGYAKKIWTGKITMKNPDGEDTTYVVNEEYLVAKPVIQVEAASVQALYRNCGNKLNVQVPALGNDYKPVFSAEGASVIPGQNRGMVTVVPTGSNVTLKVNSNGNNIGDQKFRVKLIPLPSIDIKVNGRRYDPITGAQGIRNITLTATPDKDFAQFLPEDAFYKITKVKVRKARGRTGGQPIEYSSGIINLGQMASELQTGDRVIVEILEIKRRNFRGEWEDVKMPDSGTTFSITVG